MRNVRSCPRRYWMPVGWLTLFLVGTDLFVVAPFLPIISGELGVQPSALTSMVSVFGITYVIASPLQGWLAERIGVSKILLVGVTMLSLGNLMTALSQGVPSLLASRAVAGFGAASTTPMLYELAAGHAAPGRRSKALAILGSGLLIALAMGAPAGLLLGGFSGWRESFLALAIAFAVFVPLNALTWRVSVRSRTERAYTPKAAANEESLVEAVPFLVAMMLWAFSVYAIYTLLGTALRTDLTLGIPAIACCLSAFGLGAVMGGLLGGYLADRIGPERVTILSLSVMIVAALLMEAVYASRRVVELALILYVFALCAYGFFPSLQTCVAQRFVLRRPTVMALLSSCLYVGITLGAAAGGWVYPLAGLEGVIALVFMPCVAGALMMRGVNAKTALTAMQNPGGEAL